MSMTGSFFQAEDGIRDYKVTGVQTCALPISNGGGLSARAKDRYPGAACAPGGTRPGGLFPLGHRPHILGGSGGGPWQAAAQRGGLGGQRAAPGDRDRSRRVGRDRVAAERLDDRAPGQSHESDDDEGAGTGVHSHAATESGGTAAGREPRDEGAVTGERSASESGGDEWSGDPDNRGHRGSRSNSD